MFCMRNPPLVTAVDPRLFGRRVKFVPDGAAGTIGSPLSADLRLFAMTFVAGFLFVSIFLG